MNTAIPIDFSRPILLTALKMEARGIVDAWGGRAPCAVEVIGLRACRLPGNLTERGGTCIILAGLAGALDPALRLGDVVIETPSAGALDEEFIRGAMHTSDHCVGSAAEKADLFRRTGAVAVEMENKIVRRAAQKANIPFIAIRAISDTAEHEINPRVFGLIDETGGAKPLAIMSLLCTQPGMIGELRRLGANSAIATAALGRAVVSLFRGH